MPLDLRHSEVAEYGVGNAAVFGEYRGRRVVAKLDVDHRPQLVGAVEVQRRIEGGAGGDQQVVVTGPAYASDFDVADLAGQQRFAIESDHAQPPCLPHHGHESVALPGRRQAHQLHARQVPVGLERRRGTAGLHAGKQERDHHGQSAHLDSPVLPGAHCWCTAIAGQSHRPWQVTERQGSSEESGRIFRCRSEPAPDLIRGWQRLNP
jgi:hypothetical protein